jgi:hypothetical protein
MQTQLLDLNLVFHALMSAATSRWCVGAESTLFDSACGVQRTARHTEDRVLTKQKPTNPDISQVLRSANF